MKTDGVAGEFRRVWIRPSIARLGWRNTRLWHGETAVLVARLALVPDGALLRTCLWMQRPRGERIRVATLDDARSARGCVELAIEMHETQLDLPPACHADGCTWHFEAVVTLPDFELEARSPPLHVDLHRFEPGF